MTPLISFRSNLDAGPRKIVPTALLRDTWMIFVFITRLLLRRIFQNFTTEGMETLKLPHLLKLIKLWKEIPVPGVLCFHGVANWWM